MNCKHCNAEMDENAKFCSNCGKPLHEPEQAEIPVEEAPVTEPEAGPEIVEEKKNGTTKIALAIAAVVVVIGALIAIVVGGMGGEELITGNDETIAPTSGVAETVEATIPADGNPDDVTCKGSYTGADDEVAAAGDTVVATMGDKKLTLSQLQIYYWIEVVYFLQDYGSYAAYMGLDYTQPLDTQTCTMTEEEMTWQQYFLASALDSWASYQAMSLEAEANSLEMDAEMRAAMDGLVDDLNVTAAEYEMEDAEALIRSNFGPGAAVQDYVDFWELYYTGYTYYNYAYDLIDITAEDVEAYFAENEATYAESGLTKDTVNIDVRHILVTIEGGTTDEETGETTYSDTEWETCRSEAQAILDEWLAGEATEESFAELANTYSEDPGSNTNGGLYEDVYEGQMVPAFNDWCFDESRQYGDYGLVQTDYGYHVMYFVDTVEDVWYATAESDLLYEKSADLTPAAIEKHPYEIDYSSILLGLLDLAAE